MNVEEIYIEIEKVETLSQKMKNKDLKKIAETYQLRIDQIFISLYIPLQLMERVFFHARYLRYWMEITRSQPIGENDKEALNAKIMQRFKEDKEKNFDFLRKMLNDIRAKNVEIEDYFQNYGFNTLVNTWTAFEATLKDTWEFLLNKHPKLLLPNLLNKNDISEIEGIFGKNISISLLSKYNFNVTKSLGTILLPKYDFTSIAGIKKGYSDLLSLSSKETSFLDNQNLKQMEIIRHLIVHNAGRIDEEYLKRSKRTGETLGQKLSLSTEELSNYFNSSIDAVCKIFDITNSKLTHRKK